LEKPTVEQSTGFVVIIFHTPSIMPALEYEKLVPGQLYTIASIPNKNLIFVRTASRDDVLLQFITPDGQTEYLRRPSVFKAGDPDIPNLSLLTPSGLPRMSRSYASEPTVNQSYIARMFEGDPMPKMVSRLDEVRAETEALLLSGDDSAEAQARLEELIAEQERLEPAQSKPRRRKSRNNRKSRRQRKNSRRNRRNNQHGI
jgi:hypothetical protein